MANGFTIDTYSPQDVTFMVGGYPLKGWNSISISRTVETFIPIKGIRNKHTRIRNKDSSATIRIDIIQTSTTNDVLSRVLELDTQNGTGRLSLLLKDASGRSVFASDEAYITGYPEVVYSGDIQYRQWSIYCQSTSTYLIGGNSRASTNLLDSILSNLL